MGGVGGMVVKTDSAAVVSPECRMKSPFFSFGTDADTLSVFSGGSAPLTRLRRRFASLSASLSGIFVS